MNLKELQISFFKALENDIPPDAINYVKEQKGIPTHERIGTYQQGYMARLTGIFEKDYPVTSLFMGDTDFEDYIEKLLLESPSTSHTIAEVNRKLPPYILANPPPGAAPFLYDLADLEWKMVQSFYDYLSIDDLTIEQTSQYKISSSLILFSSEWPLDKIWKDEKNYEKEPSYLSVWTTSDRHVHVERWSEVEFEILNNLKHSSTIEESVERLSESFSTEAATEVYQSCVPKWIQLGIMSIT